MPHSHSPRICKAIGCSHSPVPGTDFCASCADVFDGAHPILLQGAGPTENPLSRQYPAYFKDCTGFDELDVYAVHHLFAVADPSGCLQHASKKILLSGARTGGKSLAQDIREARDTLTRWLQLYADA